MTSTSSGTTQVLSLRIDSELFDRLQQHAARRGMNIQDYVVRTLVRDDFDERFKASVDETERFYGTATGDQGPGAGPGTGPGTGPTPPGDEEPAGPEGPPAPEGRDADARGAGALGGAPLPPAAPAAPPAPAPSTPPLSNAPP